MLMICLIMSISVLASDQEPVKCKGKTVKGEQCQNSPSKETQDGYCKVHSPKTPRCGHKTKSGGTCKLIVKKAGDKCHLHKDQSNGTTK